MTSGYPSKIDGYENIRQIRDRVDSMLASDINNLRSAVIKIEQTLGINPQGIYGSVRERFGASLPPIGPGEGDLSGYYPDITVIGLQGNAVSSVSPPDGYNLTWNESAGEWQATEPAPMTPIGPASGDLSGDYPDPVVAAIQGRAVNAALPADGYALVWNNGTTEWEPQIQDARKIYNRVMSSAAPLDGYTITWDAANNCWRPAFTWNLTNPMQTIAELHVYADGTSGDDANNGLTVSTPKKTLQAVFALVPYFVKHNTCIHLSGSFAPVLSTISSIYLEKYVYSGANLVVDGGDSITVYADNHGSSWVADISSVGTIGLSTATWAVDGYMGYWVEILSGTYSGHTRTIQGNTATTITVCKEWAGDVGLAQFRIIKPATYVNPTGGFIHLFLQNAGNGLLYFQRLLLGNLAALNMTCCSGTVNVSHCMLEVPSSAYGINVFANSGNINLQGDRLDPVTFQTSISSAGCSALSANGMWLFSSNAKYIKMGQSVIKRQLTVFDTYCPYITDGTRIGALYMRNALGGDFSCIGNLVTPVCRLGGSTVSNYGLWAINSTVLFRYATDISNCSSHAILCDHSQIQFAVAVSGTNNSGAGVYAYSNSVIHIQNGSPPTLTGTIGDMSTNGTTVSTTWSAVESGTPFVDLNELTMVKKAVYS